MATQVVDPWAALGVAILARAVEDTRKGSEEARAWLIEEGAAWLPALGFDLHPDRLLAWLEAGCPRRRGRSRAL